MAAAAGWLSYREVADLTGMHPESVRRYLNRDMPSPEFIAAFCAGLEISADWLVHGRPPKRSRDALRAALGCVPEAALFGAVGAQFDPADAGGAAAYGPIRPDGYGPARL